MFSDNSDTSECIDKIIFQSFLEQHTLNKSKDQDIVADLHWNSFITI